MKNLLLFVSLFGLMSGCFSRQSTVDTNSYNSAASPKPSATTNTANTTIVNTAAVPDEYKDVQYEQCRMYLKTLKTLSTCQALPETERKKLDDSYVETLKQTKTSYSDSEKTARDLMISVCEMSDKAMQPTLAKCK